MDVRHLDEIARALATSVSRRQAFRGLGGGALAAMVSRLGQAAADAKPKKCKKRKQIGQKCKLNNGAKCKCRGGAECKGGICTCPNGTTEYLGACVPGICTRNGLICSNSASNNCCSEHCGLLYNEFRCCVPNDESCGQPGDCCQSASTKAACESGRCCREEGAICDAVDNPFPAAKCCQGTFCSSETFKCEPI